LTAFQCLTCFEIAHTTIGFALWNRNQEASGNAEEKKRSYNPKTSHATYLELAKRIGAAPKTRGTSVSFGAGNSQGSEARPPPDSSSSDDDEVNRPQPLRLTDVPEFTNNTST